MSKKANKNPKTAIFTPFWGVFGRSRENLQKFHEKTWGHADFKKFTFFAARRQILKNGEKN